MLLKLSGLSPASRRGRILALIVVVAFAAAGFFIFNAHKNSNQSGQTPEIEHAPNVEQLTTTQLNHANQSLANKDYEQAANAYLAASNYYAVQGDQKNALATLKEATTKIPNNQLTWDFWEVYYYTAIKAGDKATAKTALQTAIDKASQTNSGATADQIANLKNNLSKL